MTEPRRFGKYSKVIRDLEDSIQTLCSQMERIVGEKDAEIERLRAQLEGLTRDDIEAPNPFDHGQAPLKIRSET